MKSWPFIRIPFLNKNQNFMECSNTFSWIHWHNTTLFFKLLHETPTLVTCCLNLQCFSLMVLLTVQKSWTAQTSCSEVAYPTLQHQLVSTWVVSGFFCFLQNSQKFPKNRRIFFVSFFLHFGAKNHSQLGLKSVVQKEEKGRTCKSMMICH